MLGIDRCLVCHSFTHCATETLYEGLLLIDKDCVSLSCVTSLHQAQLVTASASGDMVWKLDGCMAYAALNMSPHQPLSSDWTEAADDVMHISVDQSVAW